MSNLARRAPGGKESTRVLLVRQPIRSVGAAHEASPLPVQLAIGVIVSLGVVAAIWLMGFIGFHLGYATLLGVPSLEQSAGGALIAGIRGIASLPATILRSGIDQPLLLMAGFAAIAIPAAGLGAVRAASPGGPRPHVLTVVFSYSGAIAGCLFALAAFWWMASPLRAGLLQPLPALPDAMRVWLSDLRLAAGLDVMALTAMSLWIVLVMKVPVPRWLRGLAAGTCFTVLAFVFVAASVSNVTVGQVTTHRSVAAMFEGATAEQVLLLGEADGRMVTLRAGPTHIAIDMVEHPARLRLVDHRSIVQFAAGQRE